MMSAFRSWKLFLAARLCATLCGALAGAVIGLAKTNQINFVAAGIGALVGCFLVFIPLWLCSVLIIAYFAIFFAGQEQRRLEMDQMGSDLGAGIGLGQAVAVTFVIIGGGYGLEPVGSQQGQQKQDREQFEKFHGSLRRGYLAGLMLPNFP